MKVQKATHEQLKRHNRQLLLRAIYGGLADSRATLAQVTGLAKPTVSNLVAELLDEGLLVEGGRGPSTESGGKRPRLIEFLPDARQVIGLSVDHGRISGVLSNLSGDITALHCTELGPAGDAAATVHDVINGLMAQLDAPLLCIGIGVPGAVDTQTGTVRRSASLDWRNHRLAKSLSGYYKVPAYVGNSAELCALGQFAFGSNGEGFPRSLVTVLVNHGVEVGVTLEGGAVHYGGDISCLRLSHAQQDGGEAPEGLDAFLTWEATKQRAAELARAYPQSGLPEGHLSYMHIRYHAAKGDPLALELSGELATQLARVLSWVVGLIHPEHISLAGPLVALGEGFLKRVTGELEALLDPELTEGLSFSLAYSENLGAIGAVALALQKELAIL